MEAFNYVCTHLERVDELLAMLVFLFIVLVIELGFLIRSSRRHADAASRLLELKKKNKQEKLTNLGTHEAANASVLLSHLNEAADRKKTVKYTIENGTNGAQTQTKKNH